MAHDCGGFVFTVFKLPDMCDLSGLTSSMSLDDRHCEAIIPIVNTLRLRQNGRHFPDDIFKYIFLNENV